MAVQSSSPTARRFEIAGRLKELRLRSGKSVDEIADELACSTAKVSRLENGQRAASPLDVKVLARFYGLPDRVRDDLVSLAGEARKRGWWQDCRALDDQAKTYVGLEAAATEVLQVKVVRLPGLLQTDAYMNAWASDLVGFPSWSDAESVREILGTKRLRLQRVRSGDMRYAAVIDEAAIRRRVGSPDLMADQIRHLIEMGRLPNVTLRLTTYDVGAHPGMDEPFIVLGFGGDVIQDIVFMEGMAANRIVRAEDKPAVVAKFRDAYRYVSEQLALSPDETLFWLEAQLTGLMTGTPDEPTARCPSCCSPAAGQSAGAGA